MENPEKAKVAFVRCADYSTDLQKSVDTLLSHLGGLTAFVKPGSRVLIKPNMLTDRTPEQAVTTHPELVRCVIRAVRQAGGTPSVGDSPSNVSKLEKVWEKTGIKNVCDAENVPLISFDKAGSQPFTSGGINFSISRPVLEADLIINMPKVKTHVLTILTCSVKNLYGTVPGFQKATLHKLHPTPKSFAALLAAIYARVRPQLTIADGIIGMDGDGPSAGEPFKLGFLAASTDAVALDATVCRILGINPAYAAGLTELAGQGIGTIDAEQIDILGTPLRELSATGFKVPGTLRSRLIPGWFVRMLGRFLWIRPSFTDRCVACSLCVKACPVKALTLEKSKRPLLEAARCIGCCCCHEVCPQHAVELTQSPLLSVLRRGKVP